MPLNETRLGKAGEYLVCADLLLKGYNAFICESGLPYDVVVEDGRKLIRIQVKTTAKPFDQKKRTPAYLFHVRRMGKGGRKSYTNDDIDMVALVAVDTKEIGYISIAEAKQTMQFRSETLRGQYRGEEGIKLEILTHKDEGFTYREAAERLNVDTAYAWRVYHGKEEKGVFGRYLADFSFERALKCGKN